MDAADTTERAERDARWYQVRHVGQDVWFPIRARHPAEAAAAFAADGETEVRLAGADDGAIWWRFSGARPRPRAFLELDVARGELRVGRYVLHRREQWDLDGRVVVAVHRHDESRTSRVLGLTVQQLDLRLGPVHMFAGLASRWIKLLLAWEPE